MQKSELKLFIIYVENRSDKHKTKRKNMKKYVFNFLLTLVLQLLAKFKKQ